jgi:ribosomal protein L1
LEIENLEQILETEQQSRRNKDEYDAIAREILKYTPRADLARAIEEVEGEVEQIVEEQGEIHQYIEREAIAGYVAIQNVKTVRRTVDGDLKALQK